MADSELIILSSFLGPPPSPKLFISYSRVDYEFVEKLVRILRHNGLRVFFDNSDIDPGDNFVARLSKEIYQTNAIVPIISKNYSKSRWAQAELYQALTSGKVAIPILTSRASLSFLDEPLQRLLRDKQYVIVNMELTEIDFIGEIAHLLLLARRRRRNEIFIKIFPYVLGVLIFVFSIWWGVSNLNDLEQAQKRKNVIDKVLETKSVFQNERIASMASIISGDRIALGEIINLSQDVALPSAVRFNALALGAELRKGQKYYRWYVEDLKVERLNFDNINFVKTSFIGGFWNNLEFTDTVFANSFWAQNNEFSMSGTKFTNVQFIGCEFEAITAVDVDFVNVKFIGTTIDTTNFAKVHFGTKEPKVEGNMIITPNYSRLEKSIIISKRTPPEEGVLDLTMTGDDVVFDDVLFVDCRLEGWFRPEWFRNSSFDDCDLPVSLSKISLENAGNTVNE